MMEDEREIKKIYLVVLYSLNFPSTYVYFLKHMFIKIAPDIVSQNDVYSVCHIFFPKNES